MEPKNRLADIFMDLGIQDLRPTNSVLEQWGMSARRFNKIVANTHVEPLKLHEANGIRAWLKKNFQGKNQFLFESDMPAECRQHKLPLHQ